jgi:hypothetical protein
MHDGDGDGDDDGAEPQRDGVVSDACKLDPGAAVRERR